MKHLHTVIPRQHGITPPTLTEQVVEYAIAHYTDGWDLLVELYDNSDITSLIAGATTLDEAIDILTPHLTSLQTMREALLTVLFTR